jgi:hypothetical protein
VSVAQFIADRTPRVVGMLSRGVGLRDVPASRCRVNHRREQDPCCTL